MVWLGRHGSDGRICPVVLEMGDELSMVASLQTEVAICDGGATKAMSRPTLDDTLLIFDGTTRRWKCD